jgi:hypothetical protein
MVHEQLCICTTTGAEQPFTALTAPSSLGCLAGRWWEGVDGHRLGHLEAQSQRNVNEDKAWIGFEQGIDEKRNENNNRSIHADFS